VYASLGPAGGGLKAANWGCLGRNNQLAALWADGGALAPVHPISARLVTTHGDFHPGNICARHGDGGRLQLIDLDCACVSAAVFDLASAAVLHGSGTFRPFLEGYLDELGAEWSDADLNAIYVDALLAQCVVLPGRGLKRGKVSSV
jgi:Ser/Thr protein kinase RdoA (MazF antagonist)